MKLNFSKPCFPIFKYCFTHHFYNNHENELLIALIDCINTSHALKAQLLHKLSWDSCILMEVKQWNLRMVHGVTFTSVERLKAATFSIRSCKIRSNSCSCMTKIAWFGLQSSFAPLLDTFSDRLFSFMWLIRSLWTCLFRQKRTQTTIVGVCFYYFGFRSWLLCV